MHTVLQIIQFMVDFFMEHFNGFCLSHKVYHHLKMKASSLV